jgi:hypothetical protein
MAAQDRRQAAEKRYMERKHKNQIAKMEAAKRIDQA